MEENSTPAPRRDKVSSLYRPGDTIVFKYEGNVRARVTGHQVIGGKVWVEAHTADIDFLVPLNNVVGVEPKEEE
jgi:signal peptidase I